MVIVDVETTGLSAALGGRVIEVGLVVVEDGRMVAEYGALIRGMGTERRRRE